MNRLLPNLKIAPLIKPFSGAPIEEFDKTVQQRIDNFDVAAEQFDVLDSQADLLKSQILPFEGDSQVSDLVISKYKDIINQAATAGDYENMVRKVKKNSRDFLTEINPLMQRKQQYDKYVESILGDKDLIGRQKTAAINKVKELNNRKLQPGDQLGDLNLVRPAKFVDAIDLLDKRIQGAKADGGEFIGVPDDFGNVISTKIEELTEKDVARMATDILGGSAEFSSYLASESELGNSDAVQSEIANAVDFVTEKYGFRKTSLDIDKLSNTLGDNNNKIENSIKTTTQQFKVPRKTKFDKTGNLIPEEEKAFGELFFDKIGVKEGDDILTQVDKIAKDVRPFFESVSEWFFQEPKLSDEQKKLRNNIEKGIAESKNKYGQDISNEAYMKSLLSDENLKTVELSPKRQKEETQAFFDSNTGGGKFTGKKAFSNELGFVDVNNLFTKEFDLDIKDLKELREDEVENILTITGQSDPDNRGNNSFFPRYKIASRKGKEYIIDDSDNATPMEIFNHDLYKLAKENGSGTVRKVYYEDNQVYDIDYYWDPVRNSWGIKEIRETSKK